MNPSDTPHMSDSPSSSSTASDPDSVLPTPNLGSGEMEETIPEYEKPDIFSPTLSSTESSTAPPLLRTFSRSRSSSRAPAPPPILLRRPTENTTATAKGLNINLHSPVHNEEEELDGVPDLIPSPRRAAFVAQLRNGEGIPMSPAWQSFDSPSTGSSRLPSSATLGSGLVPPSPLVGYSPNPRSSPMMGSPGPKGKRFDPTPTHGIHARNMSLFFPQPGAGEHGLGLPVGEPAGETMIPAPAGRKPFGGQGEWSFGASGPSDGNLASPQAKSKRRGHHHKHSLSHNFFSFLDPTLTNPALASSTSAPDIPRTPKPADTPQSVPMPMSSTLSGHSPSLSPLPRGSDPMSQLLASFACLEFLIGAALWVEGQMGGWRCLAGVGYLVVFDAFGVGVGVVARGGEGWRSVRRPYGTTRFLSLLYFSQSLFLVFAAVYIAKESIEQVVLGASGNEHGGLGHGGHSHAPVDMDEERPFPTFLLLCATLASALGGSVMHTHAKLVDAVGSLFLSPKYLSSSIVKRFPHLLANPFSVTVMGSSAAVLVGTLIVPSSSLHTFDALAALLLTVLTTALSLPSSKAFGQVLLQTAPPASTSQMKNLQRAIKDITADHRIRSVTHTRCWAITAGSAPPPPLDLTPPSTPRHTSHSGPAPSAWHSPSSSPTVGEFGGIHPSQYPSLLKSESDAPLVITMEVEVDPDLGDREVLDVTRVLWGKLGKVCKGGSKGRVGEVSVGVKRAKTAG